MAFIIEPMRFQSRGISFADWVSLLTLCLAPVIAHVVAGAPRPSYLSRHRPPWHDRICHYNPTSIVWRYFAITHRRLRACAWSPLDLATSNALFWTDNGWDGTEKIITQSLQHCTHLPSQTRVEVFSCEMVKTIIVTLQGLQSFYMLLGNFMFTSYNSFMAVDGIFYPLSVLGLLRLCAALWLSDDFTYSIRVYGNAGAVPYPGDLFDDTAISEYDTRLSLDSLIDSLEIEAVPPARYHLASCWRSLIFRTFYLTILFAVLCVSILWVAPIMTSGEGFFTTTSFLTGVFYLLLMTVTVPLYGYYFTQGQATTTIIPCASYTWYKIYTVMVMVFMGVLFIVSCLETRKTICGKYTSLGATYGNSPCWTKGTGVWSVNPESNETSLMGLALKYPYSAGNTTLKHGEFWVMNFTGDCLGQWTGKSRTHLSLLGQTDFSGLTDLRNGSVSDGT